MPILTYATRNHAFVPATTWRIDGSVLRLEDGQGPPREVPLAEVRELRLEFAPTRPERNRFRCQLTIDRQQTLGFFNRTYAGVYDFRDTSADYVVFVRALTVALTRHAPGCRFVAGASVAAFWLNGVILAGVGLAMLAAFVFFFSAGLIWVVMVKLLFIAFYTPTAIRWFRHNRPRPFDAGAIPLELLPIVQS